MNINISSYIFLILLVVVSNRQTYINAKNNGFWSEQISPNVQTGNNDLPTQYYACKLAYNQYKSTMSFNNCGCGLSLIKPKFKFPCGLCNSKKNTNSINAIKITFCHINNWNLQISKIWTTNNTNKYDWIEYKCPEQQYISHIAGRLGYNSIHSLGLVGFQFKCQDLSYTQITLISDNKSQYPAQPFSNNKNGSFLSSFRASYKPGQNLVGMQWYFDEILQINKISQIAYSTIQQLQPSTVYVIENITVKNTNLLAITAYLKLKNEYIISQMWKSDDPLLAKYKLNSNIKTLPLTQTVETSTQFQYYTKTTGPFSFNEPINIKYTPKTTIITNVQYCTYSYVISKVKRQRVRSNFTAKIQLINSVTQDVITTKNINGTFQGFYDFGIDAKPDSAPLDSCRDQ